LLELKGFEGVNKYSSLSSLLVVKLISVERREDGFSLLYVERTIAIYDLF
jgi:hypothetical protein